MIKIENLSMLFATDEVQTKALNNINLEIKQGEFVAIMGPSGCGKSTLLNILGTLDTPTSGSYSFNGHRVEGMNEKQLTALRKGNIGFIFQSFNLIDEDRKSTRLNSSHANISYAVFCLKTKLATERDELASQVPAGLAGVDDDPVHPLCPRREHRVTECVDSDLPRTRVR